MESGLICRVSSLPGNSFQSLHAKLEPADPSLVNMYSQDVLQILEKFFDTRVAVAPFRPNALTAFVRMLQCPVKPLKDIVGILRFEIMPELVVQNNFKWSCRICLTVPPAAPPIVPLGQPGLLRLKDKMLLFLHLTRANVTLPPGQEPMSVVLPLVYDIAANTTTVAPKEPNLAMNLTSRLLQSFQQRTMNQQIPPHQQPCSVGPSIQELLFHLTLPADGPPHQMQQQQQQQQQQPMMMNQGPQQQQQMNPMMGMNPMAGGQRMMNPNMVMPQRPMMQQQPNQFNQ